MIAIPAYKDKDRGTWFASFYYTDWQGHRKLKKKRGFETKRDAKAYEEEQKNIIAEAKKKVAERKAKEEAKKHTK